MSSEKSNIEQAFEILRRLELIRSSPKEKQDLAFVRSIFITLLRQDQQFYLPFYLMDDMPSGAEIQHQEGIAPPAVVKNWLRSNFTQSQSSDNIVIVRQSSSAIKGVKNEETEFELGELEVAMLQKKDSWDFDMFEFVKICGSEKKAAVALLNSLFEDWGFFQKFNIEPKKLERFVRTAVDHYREENPYHCTTHILDVTQTLHVMLKSGLENWLNDLQRLALMVAGFVHDLEHDGLSNGYHIKTSSTRALDHNDISPQENHHLVTAFTLMKRSELGILNGLDPSSFSIVRGIIIRTVLFSDMSHHFKLLENFKTLTDQKGHTFSSYEGKDMELICSLALHAADISNPAKGFELAKRWTQRLMTEFMNQGDKERERKFPTSPMCDRFQPAVPDSQCGFIKYVVHPTFTLLNKLIPLDAPLKHLDNNLTVWDGLRSKSLEELEDMGVMPVNYGATREALQAKLQKAEEGTS